MKKLILALILFLSINVLAQDYSANSQSTKNSSTTTLDSAATYTGTIELMRGYNSISVSVRATQNGTLKILFGTSSSTLTLASASKVYLFSYTANDSTFARYVPVEAGYFKVIYVNGGDSLTTFRLITMLNKGDVIPRTTAGKVDVADATVEATLTNIEADVDSTVDKVTEIDNNTDAVEAKLDSIDATNSRSETKLGQIYTRQGDGNQTTRSVSYSLPSYTTFTAGVAADTLSGTSVACVKVTIMNASAGKILYYGFDGSVTTANGQGALGYLDTATLYVTNLNKVYLISDSASTDVRVTYFNY